MVQSDLVLVHNSETLQSLRRFGVPKQRMQILTHPVPKAIAPPKSTYISKKLRKKQGDVILCTVGYMHKFKGVDAAIKALKYLPVNYKLAILGGVHKTSDEVNLYDQVTDLINTLDLKDRVYITGFVEDDALLSAYIREADIAVYPYDRVYYANVSSGSLNLAFANETPVVAYPTDTFREMNQDFGHIVLTETFAYYEISRELQRIDISKQKELIRSYAKKYAWSVMSEKLADIYIKVMQS